MLAFTETAIKNFLSKYRAAFPTATILPKMHILEDHVVPWAREWKLSCGFMGEQGAESLHAAFNYDERAYSNMRDRVERLKLLLQNHHLKILPSITELHPPLLKKKKSNTGNEE